MPPIPAAGGHVAVAGRRRCSAGGVGLRAGLGGNESYPDLFQPYGGFPDGVRVEDGHITMPDLPGISFEGKSDLIAVMRARAE